MKRLGLMVLAVLVTVAWSFAGQADYEPLVFEGVLAETSPLPAIEVSCGVVAPMVLFWYDVNKVYVGSYDKKQILVGHLACGKSGIHDLHQGDVVVVVAKRVRRSPEEIDPQGMRKLGPYPNRFYIAAVVGHRAYAMK